jgi:hypothetical protein
LCRHYFNIFHYPLTLAQVYHIIILQDITSAKVCSCLRSQKLKIYLREKDGFYFLNGEEASIARRLDETRNAEKMWKVVGQTLKYLK